MTYNSLMSAESVTCMFYHFSLNSTFPLLNYSRFYYKRTRRTMRECHEHILQKLIVELVKDVEPEPLLLHLYQKGIIDQDDMDEIRSKKIRNKVNQNLIFKLMRRGPEAFPILVEGLQRKQPFLACLLLKEGKVNIRQLCDYLDLQQTYHTKQV